MSVKIISGAQTGADRAGIDAAIELGLQYGGTIPSGRRAEDGKVPARYVNLVECGAWNYLVRTKKNILDSDATLIVVQSRQISPGTKKTIQMCKELQKPHFVADISQKSTADEALAWLKELAAKHQAKGFTLNIAGPRESKSPGIHKAAKAFLLPLFRSSFLLSSSSPSLSSSGPNEIREIKLI